MSRLGARYRQSGWRGLGSLKLGRQSRVSWLDQLVEICGAVVWEAIQASLGGRPVHKVCNISRTVTHQLGELSSRALKVMRAAGARMSTLQNFKTLVKQWLLRWRIFWHFGMQNFALTICKQWRPAIVAVLRLKHRGMAEDILHPTAMQLVTDLL
jgi:hypothetical protein